MICFPVDTQPLMAHMSDNCIGFARMPRYLGALGERPIGEGILVCTEHQVTPCLTILISPFILVLTPTQRNIVVLASFPALHSIADKPIN